MKKKSVKKTVVLNVELDEGKNMDNERLSCIPVWKDPSDGRYLVVNLVDGRTFDTEFVSEVGLLKLKPIDDSIATFRFKGKHYAVHLDNAVEVVKKK